MHRFLVPAAFVALALSTASAGSGFSRISSPALIQAEEPPGKVPYTRVCRVCHGPEGRGDAAPTLVPFNFEFDEVLAKVREGGGEMPPISARSVSDEEVKQIFEYLKLLSKGLP